MRNRTRKQFNNETGDGSIEITAEYVMNRVVELENRLEGAYEARLNAMDTNQKSLDNLIVMAKWVGIVATLMIGGAAVLFGKNLGEIREAAKLQAISSFESAIREKTPLGEDLESVFETAKESLDNLKEIEIELAGFTKLRDIADSASSFDPLVQFYSIRNEVRKRRPQTIRLLQNQDGIQIEETTHSPEFRQRAAVVFQKLLETVLADDKEGRRKVSTNDLFNASAIAAEADLDFVAIELMEVADRIAKGEAPEIRARLIRQRLTMSRITPMEAREEIGKILSTVNGFDLHLVVSEAFNVGLRSGDAAGMARFIQAHLKPELLETSYVKLVTARLLLQGANDTDWSQGRELALAGLELLPVESSAARWYEHSIIEISKLLVEHADLWPKWEPLLVKALPKQPNPQTFAQRFGLELTQALIRLGKIGLFIQE